MDFWLKEAKTLKQFPHYYGTAYTLPTVKHVDVEGCTMNIAASIDDNTLDVDKQADMYDEDEDKQLKRVRDLAAYADPYGYAVVAYRLDYNSNTQQLESK